ncbi:hypothetical protein FBU31_008039 [Coemansia sp. 'formosensis']|nr:hypothetical protein FBU31_008039 [Coemansia sp. 'formosensis']
MLAQAHKAKEHDDRAEGRPLGFVKAMVMQSDLATERASRTVLEPQQQQQQRRPAVLYLPARSPSNGKCLA